MWTVILHRGPRPDLEFQHADFRSAERRSHALQELHDCPAATNPEKRTIYVHAAEWYDHAAKRRAARRASG